jgi:hypothetical protein
MPRRAYALLLAALVLVLAALPIIAFAEDQPPAEQPAATTTDAQQPAEQPAQTPPPTDAQAAEQPGETSEVGETPEAGVDEDSSWSQGGFDYFGTLTYWHSLDRKSGVDKNEEEMSVSFNYDDYRGRLRIGNYIVASNKTRDMRIEKYEIAGPLGPFEITAGTFSQMLGKGMVLSGIEQRDVDVDNEIEGVRLAYSGQHYSALGFIGSHKLVNEIGATNVYGGRVEAKPWDWLTAGGNAFTYRPMKKGLGGNPNTRIENQSYSVDAALKFKAVSAYMEYMRMDWPGADDGRGVYGNVSLSLPGFGLTYEYKNYWRIDGAFSGPPPVRYDLEHAAADLKDEKGYGVIMTLTPFPNNSSLIEATYAQANIKGGGFPLTEFITAYHSPTEKQLSWMVQRLYHNDMILKERAYRGEASYSWNDFFTTQLAVEVRNKDEGLGAIDEQEVSVDFGYGGWLTLVLTQERAQRGFNTTPQRWSIAEMKLQQSGKQELSVSYGKRRAGFICSGGMCRLEPEFNGWKLEYRFFF